jgi:hypothetical protein
LHIDDALVVLVETRKRVEDLLFRVGEGEEVLPE